MRSRRKAMQQGAAVAGLLAAGSVLPGAAHAFNKQAFDGRNLAEVARAFGAAAPVESKDVTVQAPEIAENGASVPISASTTLPGVRRLLVVVEKNPSPLAAMFQLTESIEPSVMVRVKMGQSSEVFALALTADGKAYYAKRDVKVTLGGCAG